jgi:hypothetical protein
VCDRVRRYSNTRQLRYIEAFPEEVGSIANLGEERRVLMLVKKAGNHGGHSYARRL